MAIIIKELIIKGKVVKELPDMQVSNGVIEDYLRKIKQEIIEQCKEQIKEELDRDSMK